MKTLADYIKLVEDGEASTNTISSGAIATKDVPLGAVKKRKPVKEETLDEGKKTVATYRNKIHVLAKVLHDTTSGKYHVKHFLNGSHHHGHDTVHDTEEEANTAAESRASKGRGVKESAAYEGENPLGDAVGKFPLAGVQAPEVHVCKDTADMKCKCMFRARQATQQNYS